MLFKYQFCCLCIINHEQSRQAKITKTKLILTTNSIVFPCIGISTCTCECIEQQFLVLEVLVKSGIGTALLMGKYACGEETSANGSIDFHA